MKNETGKLSTVRIPLQEKAQAGRVPAQGESLVADWLPPKPGGSGRVAVFVHGLASDRQGEKALYFRERFAEKGWGFLAMDLRSHGDTGGSLKELTLTRSIEDLSASLNWLSAQREPRAAPPVLIGSSMGGAVIAWHHMANPQASGPLVMLAPALTFPSRLLWDLTPEQLQRWRETGVHRLPSDWTSLEMGFCLAEDATNYEAHTLLRGYAAHTLIFQGMKDTAVPWRGSQSFVEDCHCPHLDLVLLKEGDHRLTAHKAFIFETMWHWLAAKA